LIDLAGGVLVKAAACEVAITTFMPAGMARDYLVIPQTMSQSVVQNNTQSIEAEHGMRSRGICFSDCASNDGLMRYTARHFESN
jgi:hypothetical protein